MKRSALLILDGDGFRTPDLVQELEAQGWNLTWVDSSSAEADLDQDVLPDLGLFDPGTVNRRVIPMLQALRERNPRLPLVALGAAWQDPGWFDPASLDPLTRLEREAAPPAWSGLLRRLLEASARTVPKFTAEDLFGDILSDLEGTGAIAPAPRTPPASSSPIPPASSPIPPTARAVPVLLPDAGGEDAGTLPGEPAPIAPAPAGPPPPVAASEPEAVLEQFGNYNLLEKVAVGGMAELFKARQRGVHNFEKIVAIKRILPHLSDNDEFVRMFIDEAKLAAQLSHPNIVQIYDLGKASGFYYIAMEFVDGRDLRSLLRKIRDYGIPMPEVLAATVAMKVASALDYAHRKRAIDDKELKLVHRDISPQNILISYEGAVKLVDFGIAKAATKTSQTQVGALKGKLLYMSPEQALGEPLDSRSDIYSLGLVLAELLTGERCFQADSELGVLEKVRLGKVMDLRAVNPAISREMAGIVSRTLQREVDQRYTSARLLERDLKAHLASQGNEPTEHDLAEYVNTVLKGTREETEALLAARYPPVSDPPEPAPGPAPEAAPAPPAEVEPDGPAPAPNLVLMLDETPAPAPPERAHWVPRQAPPPEVARQGVSLWLVAAFCLAVILAVWVFRDVLFNR